MIRQSDFQWDTYWWSAKGQRVPFLPYPVTVTIYNHCERLGTSPDEKVLPTDRQIEVANAVFQLPVQIVDSMNDVAEMARAECDEEVCLTDYGLGHINRENIDQYYRIESIIIPGDCSSSDEHMFFDGECDWEDEHGLRLSLKNGIFVGYSCQSDGISVQDISENAVR